MFHWLTHADFERPKMVNEMVFQQDLNGDGLIGLHTRTLKASGASSLLQAGNNYLLGLRGPR
jgi:hypothetical protein